MNFRRKLATVLAGAVIAPFIVVMAAGTASAHGYITSPPSRQANCATGKVSKCGDIIYEPMSVEGPKGQTNCHGGDARWAPLSDESKPWPAASVGDNVTFNWAISARHATTTWQYWVGGTKIAEFNDRGKIPGATVRHDVSLGGRTGRIKILAIWNIADTAMAFYNCVDLQVGPGGGDPTTTTTPPTTTTKPTTTTVPTTTTTPQQPGGAWAAGVSYTAGTQVTYGGATYKCLQSHTSLNGWEPPNVASLWQRL
ncbi:lytic polysaccharide monooxygenase [Saccharothrix violaceirubra]|uniref:Chitin-binding protein n=1 Tax=Saccharothrix violaceirubra TaxID=413306 RepID=A0A7W7T3P7_9PSEU|nr:lytic polysaccharide monooxygenase [Saccharothrix violaceirubra]MBB4966010.1 chitin-binding protein [Saccharothrix violaceirubra]